MGSSSEFVLSSDTASLAFMFGAGWLRWPLRGKAFSLESSTEDALDTFLNSDEFVLEINESLQCLESSDEHITYDTIDELLASLNKRKKHI